MRHILIDRARQRSTMRHGGDQQRVDIEHIDIPIDTEDDERLLAINAAVDKLTLEHPQIAELVKLRCFVGLEVAEAARVLHIPRATAYRRWQFARTWLYNELHASAETRRLRISYSGVRRLTVSADSISGPMAAVLPFSKVALCNGTPP